MSEKLSSLVDTKLDKIFVDYPATKDLTELREELASDLIASAQDKLKDGKSEEDAVEQAFADFGDIEELINSVLNEKDDDQKEYHRHFHSHNLDVGEDGIKIDNGKILNIDDDGISINGGKTIQINDDGIKLGNMVINDDGISFGKHHKKSFDNFEAHFDNTNFNTEVHVESLPLVDEHEFDLNDLKKVAISYANASLKVEASDGEKIKVREYMSRNNPDYQVRTELSADTLKIIQGNVPHFLPLKIKVQILIPKQFAGDLQILNRSGNLQIQGLTNLNQINGDVRSGLIYLNNVKNNQLNINANSGKVTLDNVYVNGLMTIDSRSGVTELSSVYSPDFNIEARSGSIKGVDVSGAGKVLAKSGTVKLIFKEITGDISVDNSSGTIKLLMPENDSYTFDLEAKSGSVKMKHQADFKHDISNLKEGTVGSDPQYTLTARAKSGTIKVE
ncbi:DUF4097 family beta strand repeat-containing protein [Companilactobacillus sp. HBUAS56257]|uniref:DUF4097 family beta strand repeat-containing protein n=1 Tax=Companilactobacillus sp. HBUAS56257 TaxID=3109360 RepID=UPI002FF156E9